MLLSLTLLTTVGLLARTSAAETDETKPNTCGCYRTPGGVCYCDRKAKCGCPGECEPKGCEEKRAKELENQIREETRKAEQASRAKERPEGDDDAKAAPAPSAPAAKAEREKSEKPEKPEKHAKPKLSATQRKELARLIDAYLADHPDAGGKTLTEARHELSP